jgi:cytochrome c oxidase cbb3-type subunit III
MLFQRLLLLGISCSFVLAAADKPDPAAVERGRKEFVQSCGFCHGNDATGSRGPDLIRSPLVNRDEKGELIGPVIINGRPEKEMPAFPKANVADLTAFLHFRAFEALNSAHVPHDYPVEKLLTGNARAGKVFFDANCRTCHSPTGDLQGVAKKYSPIDLQSRFLYPAARQSARTGGKANTTATITDKSGAKIQGTVAHDDEFTIAIIAPEGWYRSFDRAKVKVDINDPLTGHRELLYKYTDKDVHDVFAYLESLK